MLMLLALVYSIASKTNTCNKTITLVTHVLANQSISEFSDSINENFQGCNFFLSVSNQPSIRISDNCSVLRLSDMVGKEFVLNSEGFFDNDYFLYSFNCSSSKQGQRRSDSKQSRKFKDPFEDDKILGPYVFGFIYILIFAFHLLMFIVAWKFNQHRLYHILAIIYSFLHCLISIMTFMWLFIHQTRAMSFEYHVSIIVIFSASNALVFIWSYSALHGIGFYAERLKAWDIIALTLIIIISIGSTIYLTMSYYMYDEKTYKIIISVFIPVKFVLEAIPMCIIPKEFRAMKEKSLEGLEEDSEEYKKNLQLFNTALCMGTCTIYFLFVGALNPAMRYIIHLEASNSYFIILHMALDAFLAPFRVAMFLCLQGESKPYQSFEIEWHQQAEPSYIA